MAPVIWFVCVQCVCIVCITAQLNLMLISVSLPKNHCFFSAVVSSTDIVAQHITALCSLHRLSALCTLGYYWSRSYQNRPFLFVPKIFLKQYWQVHQLMVEFTISVSNNFTYLIGCFATRSTIKLHSAVLVHYCTGTFHKVIVLS